MRAGGFRKSAHVVVVESLSITKKMKSFLLILAFAMGSIPVLAQNRVYDESIDPLAQIEQAVKDAARGHKYVICQLGGNWCRWCVMFSRFIQQDPEIDKVVKDNFVYAHVNFKSRKDPLSQKVSKRLGNAGRFGFPVLVILDTDGSVLHIQNSSYLEDGDGYSKDKVLGFFQQWTPAAVRGEN